MTVYAFQQNRFIFIFAGLMLAAGILYYAYALIDGSGLSETEASGEVIGEEHVPYAEKYEMQNIGGVNRPIKLAMAETWLLTLGLDGAEAQVGVPQDEFRTVPVGAEVRVLIKKRRLTG